MKNIIKILFLFVCTLSLCSLSLSKCEAQTNNINKLRVKTNASIGKTTNPIQTLDINGAVQIGTTATASAGTIRYASNRFQGYNGTAWIYLDSIGTGGSDSQTLSIDAEDSLHISGGNVVDLSQYIDNRVLHINTTTNGTPATTDPDTLAAYAITANELANAGDFITFQIHLEGNGSPDGKTVNLNLGTEEIFQGSGEFSTLSFTVTIIRVDANNQKVILSASEPYVQSGFAASGSPTTTADLTASNVFRVIVAGSGTANDMIFHAMTVTKN